MSDAADGGNVEQSAAGIEPVGRDPLLLAGASAMISGGGQWMAGLRVRAWYFFGPLALAAVLAVIAVLRGFGYLVDLFVRPGFLWWLLAANVLLLIVRLASVVDAYRLGDWRAAPRFSRYLLLALVLAVIAPHAVVASYSIDAIDLLDTVFVGDDVEPLADRGAELLASGLTEDDLGPPLSIVATSPTEGPTTAGAGPTTTRRPSFDLGEGEGRDPGFLDPNFLSDEALSSGRLTFLLAGGDAGPGRSGLRTDTMIVATIDLETGRAVMFALPRNLARVPLPAEFEEAFIDLELQWAEKEAASTTTTTTAPPTTTTTAPPTTTTTAPPTTTTTAPPTTTTTAPPTTTTTTTTTATTPTTTTTTTMPPTTTTTRTTTTTMPPTTTSTTLPGVTTTINLPGLTTTTATVPPSTTTTTTAPPTTTTTVPPATTTTTQPPFESCLCYVDILNSIYSRTRSWVRTFPDAVDPGMEALSRTISNLLGIDIDYYVLVDMAGFVALVDSLGGVHVYFDAPMHIAFSAPVEDGDKAYIEVEAGLNHLQGLEALAYVRNRYRTSDYLRMERQRCMLRSIAAEADFFTLMTRFSAITGALRDSARTDIPVELLPELIRQVSRLDFGEIETIAFQPGYYAPDRDFGRYPIPDQERIQQKVQSMLRDSSDSATGGGSGESECD